MLLHGGNIIKRKGKMTEEITEVKSAYVKEIEKFLKSGGKIKYHHPDKKKIAKVTASFKKSFKITKDKEDELDAKEKAERERNQAEESAHEMNKYMKVLQMERHVNLWAEAKKVDMHPPPVDGKKTLTGKPQNKAVINPKEND